MRYAVVHGHFYQPPRENPWLESVPREAGASPFHDWNERIAAECYAANANARHLDPAGRITRIDNNYRRISFNFGPTLIAWLKRSAPETYAAILAADRESAARTGGHGNAMAQAYNHVILPLACERDKRTQVRWGLYDFAARFGRPPEGMWLPETAVDVATLEVLAAEGVRFTVLAPHQARRVRPLDDAASTRIAGEVEAGGDDPTGEAPATESPSPERRDLAAPRPPTRRADETAAWRDVSGGRIDPRRPYLCRLPSGRSIALFFYDGPLARAVAFEGVLHSGDAFADRIAAGFDGRSQVQLVHLATDGESYGHHHRFGDMALATALVRLEQQGIRVTNYAAFLAANPPEWEVEIEERTAWSCAHGVERWRSDCGCRAGGADGWSQEWRSGLRGAFDVLADRLDAWFEERAGDLVADPWLLRDELGTVLPDEARRGLRELLDRHASRALKPGEACRLAVLLEVQRARLLMFTSCGWFFDELTGIEGSQVLRYAARAIELARRLGFEAPEAFFDHLAAARSNHHHLGNGADFFRGTIAPAAVTSLRIALAGAVERLIGVDDGVVRDPPIAVEIDAWLDRTSATVDGEEDVVSRSALGVAGLVAGQARVRDARTLEEEGFVVAAARYGSFDVIAAGRPVEDAAAAGVDRAALVAALEAPFERRAHGTLVAEISRRLGPDFFGLDVLGLASRAAFFPALIADHEALVAARLAELAPLARAIAREAADVGAQVPPALATVLEAASELRRHGEPEGSLLGLLVRLELLLRPLPASAAEEVAVGRIASATATAGAIVGRLVRALAAGGASGRPVSVAAAQEFLWWRIYARTGLAAETLDALAPLLQPLGMAPEAPAAAAREAAFAALLRVVSEEIQVTRGAPAQGEAAPAVAAAHGR